jgi:three-Cys-motif partner protein
LSRIKPKTGTLYPASDGSNARVVGPWSETKAHYVRAYLALFSNAMRNVFPVRHYVDLFAGPGRCLVVEDSREFEGSPLLALNLMHPFTEHHFVEADQFAMIALRARVDRLGGDHRVHYYPVDANQAVDEILPKIPRDSCNVAVIDPTGFDFDFDSLRRLTSGLRMDLIYLFPEGMSGKRNLQTFLEQRDSRLDRCLGTVEWRSRVTNLPANASNLTETQFRDLIVHPILGMFKEQLGTLGYVEVHDGSEILVKNTLNVPLYYLVFASKHGLGKNFWNLVKRIKPPSPQQQLPLGKQPRSSR